MPTPSDPFEPYLNRAATLYDLGDVVQAGQIWQAILKRDPAHQIARAGLYKVKVHFDSRATQDGLVTPAPPEQLPHPASSSPDEEVEVLLERGCALYDGGHTPEAMTTWERVLVLAPGNTLARGYLEGAKRKLELDAVRTGSHATFGSQAPAPPPHQEDPEQLLRDGCTLFDMGQAHDALLKWERILASDPHHQLALAYANDARKELGLAPLESGLALGTAQAGQEPVQEAAPPSAEDPDHSRTEHLVLEGVQLYDMGMVEEAIDKWQRVLELDPAHENAAEYLRMALRDQQVAPPAPQVVATPPLRVVAPSPEPPPVPLLETRILEAEQLLRNQRFLEANQAFQRLLEDHPNDARIHHGHQQARALLAAETQRATLAKPEETAPRALSVPTPVGPPRALTSRATPQRQGGLKVPAALHGMTLPSWLHSPRNLGLAMGSVAILGLGLYFLGGHLREAALKQAVTSAKADAMKPVSRQLDIAPLTETPDDLRKEAEAALAEDPLLAYFRAQEWFRVEPDNAVAAQLLAKAKGKLAALPPAGNLDAFLKDQQAGDLQAAATSIRGLLCQTPDDPDLKDKARIIDLALAQYFATKERFGDAKDCLLQVRAMYPQEKGWPARLKLLETIQTMPRADRPGWIPMLG